MTVAGSISGLRQKNEASQLVLTSNDMLAYDVRSTVKMTILLVSVDSCGLVSVLGCG